MSSRLKKYAVCTLISFMPLSVIIIGNFIIYRKDWQFESKITDEIIFWFVRVILSPLAVWYTLKFWTKLNRLARLSVLQITGFCLYLTIHWIISFGLHRLLVTTPKNRIWDLSETLLKNSFILNLLVYLVIVFVLYVWEYFQKNEESDKNADKLKRSLAVSQLKVLRNQLNTHFVFNTIHNISSQIMQEHKCEANDMLINLSDLLRCSLKESNEQYIPILKEIELTRLYLELQKKRFKERLNYTIVCPENLGNFFIPPFILQPLVENAIRYAIEPFSNPGTILVQIENIDEIIKLKVADSGKTPFEAINFKGGVGLKNTRERLEQLYGLEFKIEIYPSSPEGSGVTFVIYLPLKYAGNAIA